MHRREALRIWKQRNGSDATYSELIKVFEQAGNKNHADEVRRICDSEADDSRGSAKQPQSYPKSKQEALSQLPPATAESNVVYVMMDKENLPEGKG